MAVAAVDVRWSSQGGILMDGTGDLADTTGTMDSQLDIVRSRLKSAIDGWRQYQIGAGLRKAIGQANSSEVEVVLKRRAAAALTNGFLDSSAFTITTVSLGDAITLYVYMQNILVASVTVSDAGNSLEVS